MAKLKNSRRSITSVHYDDEVDSIGCNRFVGAMLEKLAEKREEGRSGWHRPRECSVADLEKMMRDHVSKGDPVDIANFCMMIWNRRNPRG